MKKVNFYLMMIDLIANFIYVERDLLEALLNLFWPSIKREGQKGKAKEEFKVHRA
jgi:hypothetical protein